MNEYLPYANKRIRQISPRGYELAAVRKSAVSARANAASYGVDNRYPLVAIELKWLRIQSRVRCILHGCDDLLDRFVGDPLVLLIQHLTQACESAILGPGRQVHSFDARHRWLAMLIYVSSDIIVPI